jgi:hypothetical protein
MKYKPVLGDDKIEYWYGFVIRFCLTVSKWSGNLKTALPVIAAQVQLNSLEAMWSMQVRGLAGKKISSIVLPPQDLNVGTFILAAQSINAAITAAEDDEVLFIPGTVVAKVKPVTNQDEAPSKAIRQAAGRVLRGITADV